MPTPTATFALPEDLLVRYDPPRLRQLAAQGSDPSEPLPTDAEVAASPLVLAALGDATEEVLSVCQVGRRYDRAHLEALAADYDRVNQRGRGALLVRLCCDMAYALLVAGKGQTEKDFEVLAPRMQWALTMLERLGRGERVFDLDGAITAGAKIATATALNIPYPRLSDNTRAFGCIAAFRRGLRGNSL